MSKEPTTEVVEEKNLEARTFVKSLHKQVGFLNDLLLLPMFASILIESKESSLMNTIVRDSELLFCALFLLEWILGLILSSSKKKLYNVPIENFGFDIHTTAGIFFPRSSCFSTFSRYQTL